MDPIAITSSDSDSDFDLDYYREKDTPLIGESAPSSNPRVLPSWASMPKKSPSEYGGRSQTFTFPKSTSTSNGRTSNSTQHPQPSGSSYDNRSSDRHIPRPNDYKLSKDKEISVTRPRDLDAQNTYGMHQYEQTGKRSLPSSLQPSMPMNNTTSIVGTVGSSHIRDANGKSYHSEGTSLSNDKRFMNNQFSSDSDDDVIIYENSRSRILPPSLTHGKSFSITQPASSSDRVHRAGFGEERDAETDERLIYQAALQDLNQPKLEATMPDGLLSVTLLRHQKIALAWMLQKETRSLHCLGGILADDQGLGKTISMIALIQMQKFLQSKINSEDTNNHKAEALNLDDDDDNGMGDLEKVPKVEPSEEPDNNHKAEALNLDDDDDNGMGDLEKVPKVEPSEEPDNMKPELSTPTRAITRQRPAAGTLVVCPASVLRQWSRELDEKVADEAKLSVVIYHGGGRTKDPGELAKYDVVLTTYAIVKNEVPKQPVVDEEDTDDRFGVKHGLSEFSVSKKRKKTSTVSNNEKKGRKGIDNSSSDYGCGPLAKVGWLRVILDEAQTIKNHRTQVARACCSLRAKRRWCLSGTPIQNSIDDLYSYFRFLKYDPYADYKSFYCTIKIQISRNSVHGYKKLQAVLRAIMLRRTKGTLIDGEPIIKLPPKSICLNKVDFSPEERAFYSKLEADSRSQFKAYAAAGTLSQNYANILLMLLRLRQACDHPILVKGFNTESVGKESLQMAMSLPTNILMNLLNLLETSLAICLVCNDPPEDAVVTKCGHVFCYQCVSEYLTGEDNMCPMPSCKKHLGSDIVFSKATLRSCLSSSDLNSSQPDPHQFVDNSIVLQNEYCSSKIKAVLETLQSECKAKSKIIELDGSTTCNGSSEMENKEPTKAIVFSQWTSMLDLVEMSLKQTFLQYRRLDGTMSLASRDKAVRDFNTDPEVTVMIMSLKAGNLGLNMVAACHVILLDLWWNPTTEDQAIDRAHRIGQTRPVTVSRLTVKDTVEDRILALQEEKRKMVASAFGEDHGGGTATRLTVEDLRYLFMV